MRVDQSICLHLLFVEHLIGCAEISLGEILLGGAMSEEEVPGSAFFQVD